MTVKGIGMFFSSVSSIIISSIKFLKTKVSNAPYLNFNPINPSSTDTANNKDILYTIGVS